MLWMVSWTLVTSSLQCLNLERLSWRSDLIDSKKLVCVPQAAWHRTPDRRKFPPQGLLKPALVEISSCMVGNREEELTDLMKVWLGFLAPNLESRAGFAWFRRRPRCGCGLWYRSYVRTSAFCRVSIEGGNSTEHFAFLSAESEARQQHQGQGGSGSDQLQARVDHMKMALATLSGNMDMLVQKIGANKDAPEAGVQRQSALRKKKPLVFTFKDSTPQLLLLLQVRMYLRKCWSRWRC